MTVENNKKVLDQMKPLILYLRKGKNIEKNWGKFREMVNNDIDRVCQELDTRWLISVCDTFVDYGTPVEKRNAMLVSQLANFEKLWETYLLMFDIKQNPFKVEQLKRNKVIPLWDGMYSFNINHGDMTRNLFTRIEKLMVDTPVIQRIYFSVISRIKMNDTILATINKYHKRLFEPYPKRSLLLVLKRKIRLLFKQYKL